MMGTTKDMNIDPLWKHDFRPGAELKITRRSSNRLRAEAYCENCMYTS